MGETLWRTASQASERPAVSKLAILGAPPKRWSLFAVEAKYGGQRGLAVVADGSVVLFSRNGANFTPSFPEIGAALPNAVGRRAVILDGEILAEADGVPSFSRLQRRWPRCRRPGAELLRQVPVRLFLFDILTCDGENVASRSYVERRDALTARIGKSGTVQVPPSWADVDPAVILGARSCFDFGH